MNLKCSVEFLLHYHCNQWFSIGDRIVQDDQPVACPNCHTAHSDTTIEVPNMKMLEWLAKEHLTIGGREDAAKRAS